MREVVLEDADGGVRVTRVLAGSPAAKGSVRSGDRLMRILDENVKSAKAAREAFIQARPDDHVPLVVRRGAETLNLTLIAGEGL